MRAALHVALHKIAKCGVCDTARSRSEGSKILERSASEALERARTKNNASDTVPQL